MRPLLVILFGFLTLFSFIKGDDPDTDDESGMLLFYLSLKLYIYIVDTIIIQLNIINS